MMLTWRQISPSLALPVSRANGVRQSALLRIEVRLAVWFAGM